MTLPIVTLTTDFGDGPFAGLMKGVILGIAPEARLIDMCHHVEPQDIRGGALIVEQTIGVFPPGSVHLAVVDPGVGSDRRPICVKSMDMFFVGPDNGLFTPVILADPQARVWLLEDRRFFRTQISDTFHGRDVFAPVAGHLAQGLDPDLLGPPVVYPHLLDWPVPKVVKGCLTGCILGEDSFGNLTTNLTRSRVDRFLRGRVGVVTLGNLQLMGIKRNYSEVTPGAMLALFDSMSRLELAMSQGNLRLSLNLDKASLFGREVKISALRRER